MEEHLPSALVTALLAHVKVMAFHVLFPGKSSPLCSLYPQASDPALGMTSAMGTARSLQNTFTAGIHTGRTLCLPSPCGQAL